VVSLASSLHRSKPLYEQTYLALRTAILSGEIVVGERLIETQLAERFQVSRTPVREAIRRLQQESLVTFDPEGGLCVVELSLNDAIKLYECRIALEQLAVAGACQYATPEQLKDIEMSLLEAETLESQGKLALDSAQLLELNCRFHRLIAQYSGNPWLVSILDQISNQITLLRIQTLRGQAEVHDIHAEHRYIYNAIVQGQIEDAVQQVTHHLLTSQQRIVQLFQQSNPMPEVHPEAMHHQSMKCPECKSTDVSKNGRRQGKQNYICKQCGRQFLDTYASVGYPIEVKQKCLKLYLKGISFREIERRTGVNHNTVIRWVNQAELDTAKTTRSSAS
jgi:DNA-binding GntR family transcriptional regulator/transposase-like protein